MLTATPFRIASDEAGLPGLLVMEQDCLIAVLTRLDADFYEEKGRWFIEIVFGSGKNWPNTFATAADAMAAIDGQRVGAQGAWRR